VITGFDHVQLAIPAGGEPIARAFYGAVLEMAELPKPPVLAARGGCWFTAGSAVVHLGVEEPFHPARKAHPAFIVTDLAETERALRAAGCPVAKGDGEIPGIRRIHGADPFGNRLEFQQGAPG